MKFLFMFTLTTVLGFASAFAVEDGGALDDLSKEEIAKVAAVVKKDPQWGEQTNFIYMLTKEPPKAEILSGSKVPRLAEVLIYQNEKSAAYQLTVDLHQEKVIGQTHLKNVMPPLTGADYEQAPEILIKDPRWTAAMKKRGILGQDEVYLDVWAPGLMSHDEIKKKQRIVRILPFYKGTDKNIYARPIEGLIATVDLDRGEVVSIWDQEVVPYAQQGRDLGEEDNLPLREIKPLQVIQEDGPQFKVKNQVIEWQNWHFRYSMQPMKGLVLYDISYRDQGVLRPIMYKAGMSEMIVPYAEPGKNWTFRSAFDVGEYGLGVTAHPMEPNKDLPENAVYFDAHFVDNKGEAVEIKNAVGLYERDGGRLWKHYDTTTTISEVRRGRELVLTSMTTIGNYDYAFNWIFHQDGQLEVMVELTGIMLTKGTTITRNTCEKECNFLVSPLIQAPNHQHFFSFRFDLDVDGTKNIPIEVNTEAVPRGPQNPIGNVYRMKQTTLEKEKKAMSSLDMKKARIWKIINADKKNNLGHPTGYALVGGENSVPYLHPDAVARKRAQFMNHHVWFTRFHDEEQSAAGDYPNQSEMRVGAVSEGLPQWVANNESLNKEDLVMWYTLGVTHHTRPEDWPVMPVHRTGFKFIPINFFVQNPAMDVPVSK